MMNEQECMRMYEQLVKMLDEKGLEWVTAQVAEQIRIGKTIQREIETLKEVRDTGFFTVDDYPSRLKRGPKATFAVTVDYEPSERLELLIDAIKQAVVNTADMEHHLIEFCERDEKSPKKIEFRNDEPRNEPKPINRQAIAVRLDSAKKLGELLEALRKEI